MRILNRRFGIRTAPPVRDDGPPWWRWLKRLFMIVGGLVVTCMVTGMLAGLIFGDRPASIPSSYILTVNFTGTLNERPDRLALFAKPQNDFYRVLAALRAGAQDTHIKALAGVIWNGTYSIAQIREIRSALDTWREAGKPTWVYAQSLGDGASGMASYWLASAFDKIWVQPIGFVTMGGFRAEMPFGRRLLEKHGIVPEFFAFTTYKSAMDMFSQTGMRAADREQLSAVLEGLTDQFVTDVASARSLPEADIRAALRGSPYMANVAVDKKLIDRADYEDEFGAGLRLALQAGADTPFVPIGDYIGTLHSAEQRGTRVAMISIDGEITDDMVMPEDAQSGNGPLSQPLPCISCAIMAAGGDHAVKAILLRINSPGGSPVASETIRRAIVTARRKGKPVIVSMGDVAASGGYWIASAADKIVAQPTTLTGSIGVVGGKFATQGFFNDLGVTWDSVAAHDTAPVIGSFIAPYSPEAAVRMRTQLAAIYEAFKQRVAQGRSIKDVESIAKGRVWLGSDAVKIGLVDALGGLEQAKNLLAVATGEKYAKDIQLVPYIKQPSPLQGLRNLLKLPQFLGSFLHDWTNALAHTPVEAHASLPLIAD